jgi:amino acid adenylation domain-containing protein
LTTHEIEQPPSVPEDHVAERVRAARQRLEQGAGSIRPSSAEVAELSFAQERLWFLDQLSPGNPAYNIIRSYRLRGLFDLAAFEQSWAEVVARHGSLRTTFGFEAGRPLQQVADAVPVALEVEDASSLPLAEREARVIPFVTEAGQHAFDLAEGPLWQVSLLRLAPDDHVLALTLHHAIFDGLSLDVLFDELEAIYAGMTGGQVPALPEPPIQYVDYAAWQRDSLQGPALDEHLDYWKTQLAGAPAVMELPTDRPRARVASQVGRTLTRYVSPGLKSALTALARREDATTFTVLLSAFNLLLQRLTGQTDLVVGAPIAGRTRPEFERLIGVFINSLALRADLTGDPPFDELVRRMRTVVRQGIGHQALPFARLLAELQPERSQSHTPLFQVQFNMFRKRGRLLDLPGVQAERIDPELRPSLFDLTLYASEQEGGLELTAAYAIELFDEARISALLDAYMSLLEQAAANPGQRLSEFSLVTPAARAILPDSTQPLSSAWQGAIHNRLSEQARLTPDHPVIMAPEESWTYAELEARSNQLAHALRAQGLQRGEIVAIYAQRSPALIWATLGVLKAGGAYTNLDPAYPPARLQDYLELARPRGLLRVEAAGALPDTLAAFVGTLDLRCNFLLPAGLAVPGFLSAFSTEAPDSGVGPDDLACVSFTSGSTGRPKGVLCRHGPLTHFMPWQTEAFGYRPTDRFSLMSGLSHDPLQRDIFTAIWAGATLCVPEPAAWHTPGRLAAWLAESRVNCAHLTPPLGQLIVEGAAPGLSLPDLRSAFFVGDKLARLDVARLRALAPNVTCYNSYGSTETQRAVAYYPAPPESEHEAGPAIYPVGRGMPDVQLLVLTPTRQLAGIGELGEIFVRSPHLARGYLDDPDLTAARFITNPFTGQPDDRLYRTGDLGRYRPDGTAEFAGRADRQVKMRGFRLEPGEVERALSQHGEVRESVVLLRQTPQAGPVLVAYVVGDQLDPADLRAFLVDQLPLYMIPSAFVVLPALPLTPNGKLDDAALPAPDLSSRQVAAAAPIGEIERKLARLWESVLGFDHVGVHDDFFALGGHSLLAIRLFSLIEAEFGRKLPITLLFESPTIAHLARGLRAEQSDRWATLVPIQTRGRRPPLFLVHGFGGGVVGYAELARSLGDDQPVYALQAVGVDGRGTPHETVEEMAAHFVEVIRAQQNQGPYYLGGYCFGGIVAYEVARRLEAQQQPVALVAIFEGYAPARLLATESSWSPRLILAFLRNLPYWFQDYLQLGAGQMWQRARLSVLRLWRLTARRLGISVPVRLEDVVPVQGSEPDSLRRIMALHIRASAAYLPGPYNGRVVMFNIRSRSLTRPPDSQRGWRRLVRGGLEVRQIEGSHHNILQPPHVQSLARALKETLDRA